VEFDAKFVLMLRFVIILCEPLADFTGNRAYDGIGIQVVSRGPVEGFNTDGSFFQLVPTAFDGLLNHIIEKTRATQAMFEVGTGLESLQLHLDLVAGNRGVGCRFLGHWGDSQRTWVSRICQTQQNIILSGTAAAVEGRYGNASATCLGDRIGTWEAAAQICPAPARCWYEVFGT
jgi:hypothetical protein